MCYSKVVLCLALTVSAVILISCQTVVKDPNFCSEYQNQSSLFNNTDPDVSNIILGFQLMTWQPYEEREESPCVYLTDTQNRHIFVQVETRGDLSIDIEPVSGNTGTGEIEACSPSTVGNEERQYIYFVCRQSCSTSGFPFYYRIIQSESEEIGNLEYWCAVIPSAPNNRYPQDIINEQAGGTAISYSMTFQQTPGRMGGNATGIIGSLSLILALLVISVLF
ncbi:hypothetical protein LOD99_16138 [Oopsacas minuta]|uniref:Uncharacterized protein n=1 Tax=Oopsacas minuta TaxID=111878 RepID=A0AAV7K777_9METZ|nr:hypothetical protein LOD99_16138 [Oopsacas minuta]